MIETDVFSQVSGIVNIDAEIGTGGSGAVYRAWHTRLQKHVVIKRLMHSAAKDAPARRNEVEALKNIRSVYVPQVFDFFQEEECS